jgi:hypothetical protein
VIPPQTADNQRLFDETEPLPTSAALIDVTLSG